MLITMAVSDALNTYNHSIHILKGKGYSIYLKDEDYILHLEKDDFTLKAEDPLSLLTLVFFKENNLSIHEDRRDLYMNDYSSYSVNEVCKRGYEVFIQNNSDWYDWCARDKKMSFYASSPLKLLGLILMIEVFGKDWQEFDVPLYLNEL